MTRGKFLQLCYEDVVERLAEFGQGTKRLHGAVSEVASHATAKRLVWGSYMQGEESYLRLGVSRDRDVPPVALYYCANTVLLVMNAIEGAFQQDGQEFPFGSERETIYQQFGILRKNVHEDLTQDVEPTKHGHSTY
jgi:hypothetical protein